MSIYLYGRSFRLWALPRTFWNFYDTSALFHKIRQPHLCCLAALLMLVLSPPQKSGQTRPTGDENTPLVYIFPWFILHFVFVCSLQVVAVGYKQEAWVRGSSYIPFTASFHYICKCDKTQKLQFSLVTEKIKTLSYKWKDIQQSKTNEGMKEKWENRKKQNHDSSLPIHHPNY